MTEEYTSLYYFMLLLAVPIIVSLIPRNIKDAWQEAFISDYTTKIPTIVLEEVKDNNNDENDNSDNNDNNVENVDEDNNENVENDNNVENVEDNNNENYDNYEEDDNKLVFETIESSLPQNKWVYLINGVYIGNGDTFEEVKSMYENRRVSFYYVDKHNYKDMYEEVLYELLNKIKVNDS